jgi:hypothetical protein
MEDDHGGIKARNPRQAFPNAQHRTKISLINRSEKGPIIHRAEKLTTNKIEKYCPHICNTPEKPLTFEIPKNVFPCIFSRYSAGIFF